MRTPQSGRSCPSLDNLLKNIPQRSSRNGPPWCAHQATLVSTPSVEQGQSQLTTTTSEGVSGHIVATFLKHSSCDIPSHNLLFSTKSTNQSRTSSPKSTRVHATALGAAAFLAADGCSVMACVTSSSVCTMGTPGPTKDALSEKNRLKQAPCLSQLWHQGHLPLQAHTKCLRFENAHKQRSATDGLRPYPRGQGTAATFPREAGVAKLSAATTVGINTLQGEKNVASICTEKALQVRFMFVSLCALCVC